MTVIHLGHGLLHASSNLPEDIGRADRVILLFGFAPDGVYLACRVTTAAGGLLPHLFTLTPQMRGGLFLWHWPEVTLAGRYPASCPVEPGLSSPGQKPGGDDLSNSEIGYWFPGVVSGFEKRGFYFFPAATSSPAG